MLSITGAERSLRARKRARCSFGLCAAQSCTSGIDSSSRPQLSLRRETNVRKEDRPKAVPLNR